LSRTVSTGITNFKVTGSYKHDGKYHVFHHSKGAVLSATVHPAWVGSVDFQLQDYYKKKWHFDVANTFSVDNKGHSEKAVAVGRPGYQFRIRAQGPAIILDNKTVLHAGACDWYYLEFS
jgi:hypothetical protein